MFRKFHHVYPLFKVGKYCEGCFPKLIIGFLWVFQKVQFYYDILFCVYMNFPVVGKIIRKYINEVGKYSA